MNCGRRAALFAQLLHRQRAVDGKRQKTRIRQPELLLLLELLQHLPYPLGDFRIQQRGKCAACSKITAQHRLQLFFGQAALQQRGSGAAAGQLFALEPYAHTGSAVQRHRIRGYPLPDFVQIGGQCALGDEQLPRQCCGFHRLTRLQQHTEQLLPPLTARQLRVDCAAVQQRAHLLPACGRLVQQQSLSRTAYKAIACRGNPLLHTRQLTQHRAAAHADALREHRRRHPALRQRQQTVD